MDAPHYFRQRTFESETENLACDFMEQEVGRLDWRKNWPKVKENGDITEKVKAWLARMEVDHDPQGIVDFLDDLHKRNNGPWR